MNKLIVIPARGGSKGIPQKNIYPLKGKPLLSYTIEVILKADLADTDIVVSTDSKDIKDVALMYDGIYVVDRPAELSGDREPTETALLHAIDYMERKFGKQYDAVITLQPTSPLRGADTLNDFIKEYELGKEKYDALLSLSVDRADFWICSEDKIFSRLYPDAPRRRQERKPLYKENSAYYITSVEALKETHSILGKNVNGFVIPEIEGIDVNEPADLKAAEALLNERYDKKQA